MTYLIAIIFSLVSCFIGFNLEITKGNITHVRNGRKPEAGASIFPTIPLVPLFYCGAMWLINQQAENLGFYAVLGYFLIASIVKLSAIRRRKLELHRLVAEQERTEGPQLTNHAGGPA